MKLLIAARPYDLSEAPADAFVTRHIEMVRMLVEHHAVAIVGVRPSTDSAELAPDLRKLSRGEVCLPTRSSTRPRRIGRAAKRLWHEPLADWEQTLEATARAAAPDLVITVGPWLDYEYRVLFRNHRSVHLLEEDLARMPEIAAQSRQAGVLRAFEEFSRRHAGMTPTAVVVISAAELPSARRRFPSASLFHLPYSLDSATWPLATDVSSGIAVLVVGNLAQGRNAEGLVEIVNVIKDRGLTQTLPIRMVSEAGLTPELANFAEEGWISHLGPIDDVRNVYRHAGAALVPATRATGFKTTVLQAWTAGCPVVCFPASALTLGPGTSSAILVGQTADEVVDHLLLLRRDESKRAELAAAGLDLARTRFDPKSGQQALLGLIAKTACQAEQGHVDD